MDLKIDLDKIIEFLGSYGGIAVVVSISVELLKKAIKKAVDGREFLWAVGLTFLSGIGAKLGGLYPDQSFKAWALHLVTLVFTSIVAGTVHNKFINPLFNKPEPK